MSPERNPSHNPGNSDKTLRERMLADLQLRGLAERTQKGYLREVRKLAGYYNTSPDLLSEQQVADYLLHLINDRKFAAGSLNVAYNGIKFFFRHTVPRDWPLLTKLRLPKQKHKPDVLTIDQVHQLIGCVKQLHHRVYFWTIYSLGLRLEEGLKHSKTQSRDGKEFLFIPSRATAVLNPKVKSVAERSLSMVFGTPIIFKPFSKRACEIF